MYKTMRNSFEGVQDNALTPKCFHLTQRMTDTDRVRTGKSVDTSCQNLQMIENDGF